MAGGLRYLGLGTSLTTSNPEIQENYLREELRILQMQVVLVFVGRFCHIIRALVNSEAMQHAL